MGKAPMNNLGHFRAFPPLDFKEVVRPNFDTLYSACWLDVSNGPMVLHAPNSDGRYFLLPALDMYTNVFAAPGWRTTGTGAEDFVYVPLGWKGELPTSLTRIDCPTNFVWLIGRTQTNGPEDYKAVHAFQDGLTITPLEQWLSKDGTPAKKLKPSMPEVPSFVDLKKAPLEQVEKMSGAQFFEYAAELMKVSPPSAFDFSQVSRFSHVGIVPGQSLKVEALSAEVQAAIKEAPAVGHKNMRATYMGLGKRRSETNGWSMTISPYVFGSYGIEYSQRAMIALIGLGCNEIADAIYPQLSADDKGEPFKGGAENCYVIHFEKSQLPPVKAFWSFTLYDADGFAVPNDLNRATISSWMPLVYNDDGSLDVYVQSTSPGDAKKANWLPSPSEKGFNLTLRLYAPKGTALNGSWCPPAARKVA